MRHGARTETDVGLLAGLVPRDRAIAGAAPDRRRVSPGVHLLDRIELQRRLLPVLLKSEWIHEFTRDLRSDTTRKHLDGTFDVIRVAQGGESVAAAAARGSVNGVLIGMEDRLGSPCERLHALLCDIWRSSVRAAPYEQVSITSHGIPRTDP